MTPLSSDQQGKPAQVLLDVWLPSHPRSVAYTRECVGLVAEVWELGDDVGGQIELLTSELSTNAAKYGLPPGGDPDEQLMRLTVLRYEECLRVEVHDHQPRLPLMREAGPEDESGRGVQLVQLLSDDHGVYPTQHGKAVWFELKAF